MVAMATMFLSSILLMVATLHQTSGCSCTRNPRFCKSDFAIRGTVLSVQGNATAQEDLIYSIQVDEVLRNSSDGLVVDEVIEIETCGHTSCGIILDDGPMYLISGSYDTSYSIDRCNSIVKEYDGPDDASGLGLPCAASLTSVISYVVVIVSVLLHLVLS